MRGLLVALAVIGTSGIAVAQQTVSAPVAAPAYDRTVALDAVAKLADTLEARFVFPETGRAYAAMLRGKLKSGAYATITDAETLASTVTADIQAIARDGHLRLRAPRPAGATPAPGASPLPRRPEAIEQPGWIAPGIAYIRFNAFMGGDETKQVATFLDKYQGAKTLIIDARTHHGGGLDEMNQLFPRIFDKAQTVMVMDTRGDVSWDEELSPTMVGMPAPDDIKRAEHRVVPGPDSPWRKATIYYLISGRTASAAEHLASVFKGTGRATLIGETTAGAGNYGGAVDLPGGYSAFVPVGHSYFPGTKGWEGTGVAPDIAVAPEDALTEALVRAGVSRAEAEKLSATHVPGEPMRRR